MLTVEEALARTCGDVPRMPPEGVPLADALGRVLAEDVRSTVDVPPWDNTAMDGYAVIAADTVDEERGLTVLETVGAGQVATQPVRPGTAIAIMTGAPMPEGADAVVMVEDTDGARQGMVQVRGRATPGRHVRRRGEDVRAGDVVLPAGTRLTPAAIGVAASTGHARLSVARRPVVAILSTGDEVVPVGEPLRPGQIWSSNNATLAAMVLEAGAVPLDLGIAPDRLDATVAALKSALASADVVVTTGGVSVGAYDVVKEAFAELGAAMDFWRVRMKPGKPLAFGRVPAGDRQVPLFGLPGNPVSCTVNFLQFVRPWLRKAVGDPRPHLPMVSAIAAEDFDEPPGRTRLVRVALARDETGALVAHSAGSQSSGVLSAMARAQGLMVLPAEAPSPHRGQLVRVQVIDPGYLDGAGADYPT
ncbi:MAG: molybdopterin molybdotransferase MoeA [Myxococcota bacterium]